VETKHDKFRRLANRRVSAAKEVLCKIGNLASPNYEYRSEEVARIFGHLREALDTTEAKFKRVSGDFTL